MSGEDLSEWGRSRELRLTVDTCDHALDTAAGLYLNHPTGWIDLRPPTNKRNPPGDL